MRGVIFVLFCCAAMASAQPPDTLWTRRYDVDYIDYCRSVAQTADSGFVVTVAPQRSGGSSYGALIRADPSGDLLWLRTYGTDSRGSFASGIVLPDGGFAVCGIRLPADSDSGMYQLFRTNSTGDSLWCRFYRNELVAQATEIVLVPDGGFAIIGNVYRTRDVDTVASWLVRTDAVGDTLWTRMFYNDLTGVLRSIAATADGGFVLGGWSGDGYHGDVNYWMVKTDSLGNTEWSRNYGGWNWDEGTDVAQTPDGGFVISGSTLSYGPGGFDYWVVKTDAAGDTQWTRAYGGRGDDECFALDITDDGGFLLGGASFSFARTVGMWVVKLDSAGNQLWDRPFYGTGPSHTDSSAGCEDVVQTSDGGYIIAGTNRTRGTLLESDIFLVRLGPEDTLQAGFPPQSVPAVFALSAYPNPFNSSTSIHFVLPQPMNVRLTMYDVIGRAVAVLTDEAMAAGTHDVIFDGDGLPSGVYFARLHSGEFTATRKLLLLR